MTDAKVEPGQGTMEIPPGSDYLRGNTVRCQGNANAGGCLNRVTMPGDELCTECHEGECHDELRALVAKEKSKTDGKWYGKWIDPDGVSHFVCVTCDRRWVTTKYGYQRPTAACRSRVPPGGTLERTSAETSMLDGLGSMMLAQLPAGARPAGQKVPIAGCCTNILSCATARLFWGPNQFEAELELERVVAGR